MKVAALVFATAVLGLVSTTTFASERCSTKECKVSKEARKRVARLDGDRLAQAKIDALYRKQRQEVEARSMCQWGSASC
ncbi:hypothetical protein DSM104440_01921 [Usitatibacter palustris]|uniref:Uncharacterized protein n=1 Tax=Usitatibacter palustris TaxID=2732487 RepID=A0A6M4H9N4_9PROT|nr:hypothetical protein DSM104440_01921 [Usitatibacter palustris]